MKRVATNMISKQIFDFDEQQQRKLKKIFRKLKVDTSMETRADTGEGKGTCPPLRLFRGVMLPPEFCPSPLSSSGGDCNFVPPLSGSGGDKYYPEVLS